MTANANKRSVCITDGCMKRKNLNENGVCPTCIARTEKFENATHKNDPIFPCGLCNKEVKTRGLMCNYCEKWTHSECLDIAHTTYDEMMKLKEINSNCFKWFCMKCENKIEEVIEKTASLETLAKSNKADIEAVVERLESVESKLAGTVHKEISDVLNERSDIERRKMNLVIYNIPEAEMEENPPTVWDSPKRTEEDTRIFIEMIKTELHTNPEGKIKAVVRRGRRLVDGKKRNRPRPIKVIFKEAEIKTKRDILTRSKELRNSTDPVFKNVFINPDLTPDQRTKDKELREMMWKIRSEEKKNVVIQKGKIVEVPFNVRKTRQPTEKSVQMSTNSNTEKLDKPQEDIREASNSNSEIVLEKSVDSSEHSS